MKRNRSPWLILAVAGFVFATTVVAANQSNVTPANGQSNAVSTESDKQLTETVRQSLRSDSSLTPALDDVQLKAMNGSVYLKGRVDTQAQRMAIEEKVKTCSGVAQVFNYIKANHP